MTMATPATITATTNTTRNRRSRSRRSGQGRVPLRAAALTAGIALLVLAAPRLVGGLLIAEHETTLRSIAQGRQLSADVLLEARRDYEASLAWYGGGREWADLGRLSLQLAIAPEVGEGAARALLEAGAEAYGQALGRAPANTFAWASLSEVELLLHGPIERFQAAYVRSIATGPAEPALARFRLRVGFAYWPHLNEQARRAMTQQVQIAASIAPAVLASEARTPVLRDLVAEVLGDRADLYARFAAALPPEE